MDLPPPGASQKPQDFAPGDKPPVGFTILGFVSPGLLQPAQDTQVCSACPAKARGIVIFEYRHIYVHINCMFQVSGEGRSGLPGSVQPGGTSSTNRSGDIESILKVSIYM